MAHPTTHGETRFKDSRITIHFGYLPEDYPNSRRLSTIELDVTEYATILARNLLTATIEQEIEREEMD